jgi:6-phosphogluconolactonase
MAVKSVEKKAKNTEDYTFYVGTYTKKDSKGIYRYALTSEGKLKKIGLVAVTENPSFLALSPDKKYVLAVNEVANENTGFVSSYAVEKDSLVFINKSSSGGKNPCYVKITENRNVLVANYSGGNVGLLNLNKDGKLSELLDVQQHSGKGTTERQKGPHAHSVYAEKNNEDKVIAVDLGTNQVWFSEINAFNNKFLPTIQKLNMATGAGPRHLTFHPSKNDIYVLNELDNTITLVTKNNGVFEKGNSISTIPADFTEFTKAADIHISKDGKFVYASNRGYNSIAIFSVNPDNGTLTFLAFEATRGEAPRNFSLSPDDKFLLVANQDTDTIIAFSRNSNTGLLTYNSTIDAPTPVCILFD